MAIPEEITKVKRAYPLVGDSQALVDAIDRALRVAPFNLAVLITGESGVGKEVFPRIIHDHSPRKHNKYLAINCGAIPSGTITSELFGHVKGAFTDASSDRDGYFQEADGGTIFLDEVAEMPEETQAMLLRVLENGEFVKVGSSKVQKTNVRIVAATNKDLFMAVKDGKFRADLYYRLSTVQISIPALRERGNDILKLARFFSHNFADNYRTPDVEFTDDAKRLLLAYPWPGNVRQLKSIIEQISLFEAGNRVDGDALKKFLPRTEGNFLPVVSENSEFNYTRDREVIFHMILQLQNDVQMLKQRLNEQGDTTYINSNVNNLRREASPALMSTASTDNAPQYIEHQAVEVHDAWTPAASSRPHTTMGDIAVDVAQVKTLDETERETIAEALTRNHGRRKRTAEELNISERTLYRKIKQYNLEKLGVNK